MLSFFLLSTLLSGTPAEPLFSTRNARHELVSPRDAGLNQSYLQRMTSTIEQDVARGGFPGASLAVGRFDKVVLEQGVGLTEWHSGGAVDPDETVYDLASLTKVVATTTAIMLLVEDGLLNLDEPVYQYLPTFRGEGKERITVRHLLTHTAGLPEWMEIRSSIPSTGIAEVLNKPLEALPGTRTRYTDIGFVVLWEVAQNIIAPESLPRFLDRRVFSPLGMRSTTFSPGAGCTRCAPTALLANGRRYQGIVHDPIAQKLGGVTGNAGLFSTSHDLARFAAMLANKGELNDRRILRSATIELFARRQPGAGTRALGWDTPSGSSTSGAAGDRLSLEAFGHTGFTGTSLWVDPSTGIWVVLLSNRTYQPRATNNIQFIRRQLHGFASMAVEGGHEPVVRRKG